MSDDEKIRRAAKKVLKTCAASSFNAHFHVCPWNDSNIAKILKQLDDETANELAFHVVVRAIEFRRQYGCHGSKHFQVLMKHHGKMHEEIGQRIRLTKSTYWNVVDICAINTLIPSGQRVGGIQIQLWSKKGVKK